MLINLEKSFKKIQSLIIKNFNLLERSSSAEISSDVWKGLKVAEEKPL